jgi:hypothetical protein
MIYAVRVHLSRGDTLVEFKSRKEMDSQNGGQYRAVTADYAHTWVKRGGHHETGLYVDEGRVRYAPADPEGMQQPRKRRRKR